MHTSERRYYDRLAPEYEDWALARGRYAANAGPGWEAEFARLIAALEALPPRRVLDVGCGTGIFTRHLRGDVVGLDQSERMLELARERCPDATFVVGDGLALPFEDHSFDVVFCSHFYGHLRTRARERFLREARRVAPSLVVVENALPPGIPRESVQHRMLEDGSAHEIYKRFFSVEDLADEVHAAHVVFSGDWFVIVAAGPDAVGPPVERRRVALGTLAPAAGELLVRVDGDADVSIAGLSCDWSRVRDGDLYFVVEGGRKAAAAAGAIGAAALCVDRPAELGLPEVVVTDVRRAMARTAAAFFGHPADELTLLCVTGTNGKTTTSFLIRAILEAAGHTTGLVGSLGTWIAGDPRVSSGTTPEACELHALFAEMRSAGVDSVAMEVTSHALALDRVDGLRFAAAAFTNLTHDHLDFHEDLEDYFEVKRTLFVQGRVGSAAFNVDDPYGCRLAEEAVVPFLRFGSAPDADVRAEDVRLGRDGSTFRLVTPEGTRPVSTPLVGAFNISNCLAAATVALQAGLGLDAIVAGLRQRGAVEGRLQIVDEGQPFSVLVDFAHSPASLENVLVTARLFADGGRVVCVFGCGGSRDREKRPVMGAVAAAFSDQAVVTSDNPRDEDPDAIIRQILSGVPPERRRVVSVRPDRGEAIAHALGLARAGDVVVIAGKGTERYQKVGGQKLPFDDREVARRLIRELGWSAS